MLSWLANAWRVPELRRRVLFTAAVLAAYRLGSWMPAPGVDQKAIQNFIGGQASGIFGLLSLFSGGGLARFSIFALGIMPYVTASIILQLATVVIPSLEQLQKEGEAGYAKINQYTRYLTVVLAAAQAAGYGYLFKHQHVLNVNLGRLTLIVITLTAGCTLLMWMGELITKRGIGNGISLLIFASILTSAPAGISAWINGSATEKLFFPIVALGVVVAVVFVQEGQRRIPIQYAKRMVGRRQTAGGSTYMPLRVNMAGVIPVIFAAALLALPQTVGSFAPGTQAFINAHFSYTSWTYLGVEAALIVVFTFVYTAVQFNPVDQADNLRKYGGYIPGIRPGPPTAQYLDRVLTRLTLPGALFLAIVAVLPSVFINYFHFSQATSRALGGTSVLIVVGVALDTMRQMESQMMMRSYEGFFEVNLLVLGPQGAGKGTQAKRIASEYSIPHISTGDMFRAAIAAGTSLGKEVEPLLAAGTLVPDETTIAIIRERLADDDAREGFVLDGYPRNPAQADALDDMLGEIGRSLDAILFFDLPDDVATERMLNRAVEEGRPDDTPEVMAARLATYHEQTAPIVEHYRVTGKLVPLHAERTVGEVWNEIQEALEQVTA